MNPKSFVRVRQREVGHKKRHRHAEKGRGREWRNGVTSQGTLGTAGSRKKLKERHAVDSPPGPPEGTLISDFWIPEL